MMSSRNASSSKHGMDSLDGLSNEPSSINGSSAEVNVSKRNTRGPVRSSVSKADWSRRGKGRPSKAAHSKKQSKVSDRSQGGFRILDEEGNDVTPESLLATDKPSPTKSDGKDLTKSSTLEPSKSNASTGQSSSTISIPEPKMTEVLSPAITGHVAANAKDKASVAKPAVTGLAHETLAQDIKNDSVPRVGAQIADIKSPLMPAEGPLFFSMSETETTTILSIAAVTVNKDTEHFVTVAERNSSYHALCALKARSDNFAKRHTQTINLPYKHKEVQAAPPATKDASCQATNWDIYDSTLKTSGVSGADVEDLLGAGGQVVKTAQKQDTALSRQINEVVAVSLASEGCLLDPNAVIRPRRKDVSKEPITSKKGLAASRIIDKSSENLSSVKVSSNVAFSKASSKKTPPTSTNQVNPAEEDITRSEGGFASSQSPVRLSCVDPSNIVLLQEAETILRSPSLITKLSIAERYIQQNVFHKSHLCYRDFPEMGTIVPADVKSADRDEELLKVLAKEGSLPPEEELRLPGTVGSQEPLKLLWSFACDLVSGRSISTMVWNKANQDLLAVAYGLSTTSSQNDGLVLFWSLKNPEYPERLYRTESGVTAVDFSAVHPNLLAIGMYNGGIAIYDTKKQQDSPVLESRHGGGSHMDAVWQVKWLDKGGQKGETLVSIASDGRVTEWSMSKGLTHTDLMVLRRVSNPSDKAKGAGEGVISRQASGQSIDFPKSDTSTYFAGTDDGTIHKCSFSYNEQYLQTYFGHTAPVYKIRVSSFYESAFLSCSADWTVKLWDQKKEADIFTLHSVDLAAQVNDITWSPHKATVFASVTGDGRIEIWDLAESTLDPIIKFFPSEQVHGQEVVPGGLRRTLTAILFAKSAPVVVVGDTTGRVMCYRLYHPSLQHDVITSEKEQADKLKKIVQGKA